MRLVVQKNGDRAYVSFRESYWDPIRKKYSSRTIKNFGRLDLLLENDPDALEKLRLQAEQLNAKRETAKQTAVQQRLTEATRQMEIKDDPNADNRTVMIGAVPYRQIWNKLNLTRKLRDFQQAGTTRHNLAEAIFYMTVARSLMPDSGLAQWNKHNTSLYRLFAALSG